MLAGNGELDAAGVPVHQSTQRERGQLRGCGVLQGHVVPQQLHGPLCDGELTVNERYVVVSGCDSAGDDRESASHIVVLVVRAGERQCSAEVGHGLPSDESVEGCGELRLRVVAVLDGDGIRIDGEIGLAYGDIGFAGLSHLGVLSIVVPVVRSHVLVHDGRG